MIRTFDRLALGAATLLLLGLPTVAQTPLVEEGDAVAGVGNVTSVGNLVVNDSGDWIVEVDTDNADTNVDGALVGTGGLLLREGQALAAPVGATIDSFDALTLNDAGQSGWNFFIDGTTGGTDDSGIYFGSTLVLQESTNSGAAGLSPGTPYIGFFETKLSDGGDILVLASVDDPAIASTVDRALVVFDVDGAGTLLSETVIAKEGDLLSGQTETVADFETGPHNFAYSDQGGVMFIADLNGDTAVDHAVYVDDVLVAQEGSPSPVAGRNWSTLSSAELDLNDDCGYVLSGLLDGDTATNALIVKNGAAFRQEGDTLAAISPFLLTSLGTGPVALANSGNVLWYGDWDDPDTDVDTGLFVDDQLLVQEGVTTIGGVVVDTLRGIQDGYAISPNGRYVVFEAVLVDGTEGAYLIDRGVVAHQEVRNGTGVNALCFKATSTAVLGGTWTVEIDASNHPGASVVLFYAHTAPASGPVIGFGELLINLGSPRIARFSTASSGGVDVVNVPVPNDIAIVGQTAYTQAAIAGGFVELCNAIDATAGN